MLTERKKSDRSGVEENGSTEMHRVQTRARVERVSALSVIIICVKEEEDSQKRERNGGGYRHRAEMEKDYARMDQSKAKVQELEKDEPAVDVRHVPTADGVVRSERLVEGAIGEREAEQPIEQVAGRSGGVYVPSSWH
jgi:hypothetical protein